MNIIVVSAFAANVVGFAGFQHLPLYIRQLGGAIDDLGVFFSVQTAILALLVLVGGWLVIGGPIFFSPTSDIAPRERRAAYFGYMSCSTGLDRGRLGTRATPATAGSRPGRQSAG